MPEIEKRIAELEEEIKEQERLKRVCAKKYREALHEDNYDLADTWQSEFNFHDDLKSSLKKELKQLLLKREEK